MNAKIESKENKIENEKVENRKFVVKVYHYTEQLLGAVVCVDEGEAEQIADEIVEYYIPEGVIGHSIVRTQVEEITEDFADEIWREWAKSVEKTIKYGDGDEVLYALNIMTDEDYRKKGFHLVRADYDKLVFKKPTHWSDYEFIGWYDVFTASVIDVNGEVIGTIDENGELLEYEKIEKKLEEFLGVSVEDLKNEIIEKAVWLRKDNSKIVVVRVFPNKTYDVSIRQVGHPDGYKYRERLWAEFYLIEPWDLPEFETVVENDNGGWIDQDKGDKFKDDDELLGAVRDAVLSGSYDKFKYEWNWLLSEFYAYVFNEYF